MVNASCKIAIIGAGVAGLTCARDLATRGIECVVFDKGRGLGGRLATRRADGGFQFDHGAPYLRPKSEAFRAVLEAAQAAGAVGRWSVDGAEPAFVGVPGMTGFAKHLAMGLDVHRATRIERMTPDGAGWRLDWAGGEARFDMVVMTTPAPQTVDLLPEGHPVAEMLAPVRMDPCLTLMVGMARDGGAALGLTDAGSDEIAWIAEDSTKPGRPDGACFVAHASTFWSHAHLELDLGEVEERFLPLVLRRLGLDKTVSPAYVSAHRWRYARASRPLGTAFLMDDAHSLFVGGDWCLGDTAEDAWQSGRAISGAIAQRFER